MSEKTEQPSQRRLTDARHKGQIPRSKLFTSAAVTLGGLAGLVGSQEASAARLTAWTERMFSRSELAADAVLAEALWLLAGLLAPVLAGALLASLAASVTSSGLQLNVGLLAPKLERLDPSRGLKRLFSPRQLVEVGKALLVTAVVGLLVWNAVEDGAANAFRAVRLPGELALSTAVGSVPDLLVRCGLILLVLGVADLMLAKRRHLKDLMMSREEVKQEYKNSEGDPHHKGQRKALHRQLASAGPARGVHKATAVVVNPTHIAVALRYDEAECEAPYIVAKGREEDALMIRREATALGVPVVRDVPLARSLIHYDVGEEIPEELYQAAAAILKVAMEERELDGRPAGEM